MTDMRYLNVILTILTVVLVLNLVAAFSSSPPQLESAAYAQGIPDEGAQRNQIIEELRRLNRKADELRDLLISGRVHVSVSRPAQE